MFAQQSFFNICYALLRYYEFIDHYKFDREIVGVAINYFDRYISSQTSWVDVCTKEKFQIIAITSLFLAIKLHSTSEDTLIESRSRALARLLYSHADPQEIYEMEMDILQKLDWHLNPSTLHQFALSFCQLHPLGDSRSTATSHLYLYDATRYQVELAIFIPALLATFTSSVIAYAALKNAEEKIAADKPHVLTAYMKQSFEKMMKDPTITVGMDPTAVAQCKLSLKRLCPQLPDLDYFGSDTDTSFISTGYYAQDGASHDASISPLNVVDY